MTNRQGKILAIDDEPMLLDMIKYNLENEGYSVDICNSIESALTLNLSTYNLIIYDVTMGKISSIEFLNMLKQNSNTSHIPIIISSEKIFKHNIIDLLKLGADDYILKPIPMRELAARIRSLLRRCYKDK